MSCPPGLESRADTSGPGRSRQRLGAYGLELTGMSDDDFLVRAPASLGWPRVSIHPDGELVDRAEEIDAKRASLSILDDAYAVIDRHERSATFCAPGDEDGRLIHPFLSAVGVVFAWWHG